MNPSKIGIELELQLLDNSSYDLVDKIEPLLKSIGEDPNIDHEVFLSCIEVKTDPLTNLKDAKKQIFQKIQKVLLPSKSLEIELCSLSVHPFSQRTPKTSPQKRYLELERNFPYITHHQTTFSTQIHVSMSSLEESVQVMNKLRHFLPCLAALSASCPFWQGKKTEFVSFRQFLLQSSFNGGTPPHFQDHEEFNQYIHCAKKAGVVSSIKDVHWDIRPRPDFGTLEVRIMDAVPSVKETMALIAFAWCLVDTLKSKELKEILPSLEDIPWAMQMNQFQASHLGIDAPFILNRSGEIMTLRDLGSHLFIHIQDSANKLDVADEIQELRTMMNNSELPYQRMQNLFDKEKSLNRVVEKLSLSLRHEVEQSSH